MAFTCPPLRAKSVTHVSGTFCYLCLGSFSCPFKYLIYSPPQSRTRTIPDLEFSSATSLTFVSWNGFGERVPLTRTQIQAVHGTVPLKCAGNTLPARPGILHRPAPG